MVEINSNNKRTRIFTFLITLLLLGQLPVWANQPDSVYLMPFATPKDNGRSGLRFAWSSDGKKWDLVGSGNAYVRCDYGAQKFLRDPYPFMATDGQLHIVWSLNDTVNQFAHVATTNLVNWQPQRYPFLKAQLNFNEPVVQYDGNSRKYAVYFRAGSQHYKVTTTDFKTYDEAVAVPASAYTDDRIMVDLPAIGTVSGKMYKVAWPVVARLNESWKLKQYKTAQMRAESAQADSSKFAMLKPLTATITLQPEGKKTISDLLIGVFFEDINYSADGGLYAELVQNRDFEYQSIEKLNRDSNWNNRYAWTIQGENIRFAIDTAAPLHPNNPHYAVLEVSKPGGSFTNSGFDGIVLKKGDAYTFSLFAKNVVNKTGNLLVKLVAKDGSLLAQSTINTTASAWKKYTTILVPNGDAKEARLELQPQANGSYLLDMISLFPQKTFKNRKNGMRPDLAETIAAIHPKFIRFPGGCVAHGDGIENMYRWKNSIGPLESRKPQPNIWRYHQSVGIGYYEYFQYCEDVGATPLPIIPAGVPCQNSGAFTGRQGQNGGIPISQMDDYIQDIYDLIEWANGPATSKWGKLRAVAGHPAPFHLKYVGIGNEDLISDVFEERFIKIFQALQQKHPEIKVVGTTGPFQEGTDYEYGWDLASKLNVPVVDEHYYDNPGWFINNQDFYDQYDRSKPKVYLGEYASRGNTLFNALTEALYLTNVERNADVVSMTSYAPLLAKEGHTQWNPDMIYFNNSEVKPTVNYEVQKLFGSNAGDAYLPSTIKLSNEEEAVKKRIGVSVVQNTVDGSVVLKLVNLLPVPTTIKLDLGKTIVGNKVTKSVLQGMPTERAIPVTATTTSFKNLMDETLAPYSLVVLRIEK